MTQKKQCSIKCCHVPSVAGFQSDLGAWRWTAIAAVANGWVAGLRAAGGWAAADRGVLAAALLRLRCAILRRRAVGLLVGWRRRSVPPLLRRRWVALALLLLRRRWATSASPTRVQLAREARHGAFAALCCV